MRRTWRLRPSWIVSSSRFEPAPPTRRARAGAVTPSSSATPARKAPQRRAPRPARRPSARTVGLRHLEARVRQAVGELAVVGEQDQAGRCRRRAVRPGTGAARARARARRRSAVRVCRARSRPPRRACSARRATRGSGPASGCPSSATRLPSSTSRAGSVTISPSTLTRPARDQLLGGAPRGDARVGEVLG